MITEWDQRLVLSLSSKFAFEGKMLRDRNGTYETPNLNGWMWKWNLGHWMRVNKRNQGIRIQTKGKSINKGLEVETNQSPVHFSSVGAPSKTQIYTILYYRLSKALPMQVLNSKPIIQCSTLSNPDQNTTICHSFGWKEEISKKFQGNQKWRVSWLPLTPIFQFWMWYSVGVLWDSVQMSISVTLCMYSMAKISTWKILFVKINWAKFHTSIVLLLSGG